MTGIIAGAVAAFLLLVLAAGLVYRKTRFRFNYRLPHPNVPVHFKNLAQPTVSAAHLLEGSNWGFNGENGEGASPPAGANSQKGRPPIALPRALSMSDSSIYFDRPTAKPISSLAVTDSPSPTKPSTNPIAAAFHDEDNFYERTRPEISKAIEDLRDEYAYSFGNKNETSTTAVDKDFTYE